MPKLTVQICNKALDTITMNYKLNFDGILCNQVSRQLNLLNRWRHTSANKLETLPVPSAQRSHY